VVDSLIPEYGGNLFNLYGYEDRIKINIADVRDEFSMARLIQDRDYLFNLAGQTSHMDSMHNPYVDLDINCRAQLFILEACRKHNPRIKVIYASTRQIYGKPKSLPVNEEHILRPTDVNGINKMAGELFHILYNDVYNIKSCALRLTNTYGPRMRIKDARQTFLGIWIKCLIENKPIDVWGDGEQVRDFNYVEDVITAMLSSALREETNGQVYNLGSPEHINLKDLAMMMIRIHGRGNFQFIPFPKDHKSIDIGDYYSNYDKINRAINWSPTTSLEEGLSKTIEYYNQHFGHYQ
ncbi:MAG: NAD-dependent epimerase/dehydratase family protein, partial [Deltaproteobacteria bacterium]|nr:NAD-dependent epimerase/dehydratase family protein [Deltaproteobacteria bacterium]